MSNQEPERESYTLFVGEGDFSFSANYILKHKACCEKVYASCLTDQELTDRQLKNVNTVIENGGFVFTDVDATRLEYHPKIKDLQFSKIIFNFPHIPGKMNIRKNRQLVEQFFLSSKRILNEHGMVIITLCKGQGGTDIEKVKRKWSDTWQIVSLAASASFILSKIQPFNASEFDIYQCTGFRGSQKPFKTEGALTHMFTLGTPISLEDNVIKSYLDPAFYLQNVEDLLRNINCITHHPYNKVSSILNNIAQKLFHSFHQETVYDLITCMKLPSVDFDIDITDIGFCKDCILHLVSLYFMKHKSGYINSFNCTLCCIKNICINNLPFCYLQAYFSDDISNLLTNFPVILKHLNEIYTSSTGKTVLHFQNDSFQVHDIMHYASEYTGKESRSIKSILNLYVSYTIYHGEEYFFYTDAKFSLLREGDSNEIKSDFFKCGSILQINDNMNIYFCILFDINILSRLKYHIMDCRIFLAESSFYSSQVVNGHSVDLYRSLSLYPPTFVHDVSFYTDQNFNENDLFQVVRNAAGYIIKSVDLIDSYYNDALQKHSRCYRFIYQSYDKVLSRSKVDYIQSRFIRKVLEKSLNITLR